MDNGRAVEVSILNVPAFLYKENICVQLEKYGNIHVDIAFGGSFFAMIDAEKMGLQIATENIDEITDIGMKMIEKLNETVEIKHPYLDITTVDLAEFYCSPVNPKADKRNVVIFGLSQADRSPCGTGTSAKLAMMYSRGEICLNEEFIYESITGSLFKGVPTKEIKLDGFDAIIPKITGSAYITGDNTWILDEADPLKYGFFLGKSLEHN